MPMEVPMQQLHGKPFIQSGCGSHQGHSYIVRPATAVTMSSNQVPATAAMSHYAVQLAACFADSAVEMDTGRVAIRAMLC